MILKILFVVTAAIIVALVVAIIYGNSRWDAGTTQLRKRLDGAQVKQAPQFFSTKELEGLPAPVKRYFSTVLKDGQPIVTAATVTHRGTFNMGETTDNWKPFSSTQRVITSRPGFDWDARIIMFPGVAAHVHDAYIAGSGLLQVAIFGLIPVVNIANSADLSKGEFMRFCAEAAWYPTALLPSQGVVWEDIDAQSANATFTDGNITVTLRFSFRKNGLIDTVLAPSRGRLVGNEMTFAPWQGRFSNYAERSGMQVPMEGEIAWLLPEGAKPYYRGVMTDVSYVFAK